MIKEIPVPAVGKLGSLGEDIGQKPSLYILVKNLKNILDYFVLLLIPKSNQIVYDFCPVLTWWWCAAG